MVLAPKAGEKSLKGPSHKGWSIRMSLIQCCGLYLSHPNPSSHHPFGELVLLKESSKEAPQWLSQLSVLPLVPLVLAQVVPSEMGFQGPGTVFSRESAPGFSPSVLPTARAQSLFQINKS